MNRINIAVKHANDRNISHKVAFFSVRGSLTKSAATEVKILMHRLLSNESRIVNLDMSGLDSIDLWGANQLVTTICRILARGQKFNIWCEKPEVRHLLGSLGINELVPILSADRQSGVPTPLAA